MKKRLLNTLFLLLISLAAFCQPQRLYFHHLEAEREGELSQATNFFVFKDSKGFLWASSTNGLNRFDGRTVKVYTSNAADTLHSIFGNNIQSPFYEDIKQNIWFSTYEGINCYIRKYNHFIHDTIMINDRSVEGYYIAHLDNDDNLWLTIQKEGVFQYNIKTEEKKYLHRIFERASRLKVFTDKVSGKISRSFVYGQGVAGLQIFEYPNPDDYTTFQTQTFFDGTSSVKPFESMIIFDVLPESDTLIWLGTPNGIMSFNPAKKSLEAHGQFPNVTHIEPFKDDYFLLSSLDSGLALFDKRTRRIVANYRQQANNPHSLRSNSLSSVYADSDGIIWASVNDQGLDFAHPDNLKFDLLLPPSENDPWKDARITALAKDGKGRIWCGTHSQGVLMLTPEGKLIRTLTTKNSALAFDAIISILPDNQDRIWIMTWGGVSVYDLKTNAFKSLTPGKEVFYDAIQLKNGKILFSSYTEGIYELVDNSAQGLQLKKIESIKSKKPYFPIYQDKNNMIWACENAAGIKIFDINNNYKLSDSLPIRGMINEFYEDPDSAIMWLASTNGLVEYHPKTRKIKIYDRNAGFASQEIQGILPDEKGNLWLSTTRGLILFNRKSKDVKNFSRADGLSAIDFSINSALQAADGKLWFGSSSGITRFQPQDFKMLPPDQKAQITGIMVHDVVISDLACQETGATNVSEIKKIVLKHHENILTFEFAALEYSDPENSRFEYKMEKYEENWIGPITEGRVRYTNLPPGNYTFKIRVINSDGVLSKLETNLFITIQKPWWATWWARILEGLLIIVIFLGVIYFILRPRLAVAEVRQRISADLHDDIGSALTTIKIASQLALSGSSENGQYKKAMTSVAEISSETLDKMRDIIWANNPENNLLEDVILRMRTDARRILPENIELELDSSELPTKEKLPGDKRYHMHLIFKEALINAVKYAEASTIKVTLTKQQRNLILKIADNGKGFPEEKQEESNTSGGNGLRNMRDRAKKLNGTVDVTSIPKKGVTVLLNFSTRETYWTRFVGAIKRLINLVYPLV